MNRRRFLGRVAELPERFGTEIHAFVRMDNRQDVGRDGAMADVVREVHGLKYAPTSAHTRRLKVIYQIINV